jgi:3D (Asp-Asp-Asp) domain-containing protein
MRRIAFHLAVPGLFALIAMTLLGGTRGLAEPSSEAPRHRAAASSMDNQSLQPAEFIGDSVTRTLTQAPAPAPAQKQDAQDDLSPVSASRARARIVMMEVTAYCPCSKCCGPHAAGITASGLLVSHNDGHFVAADRAFPFHTQFIIPGYAGNQPVPVLDRGGASKGNKLDVFFPTHEQALKWGRRKVAVMVIDG